MASEIKPIYGTERIKLSKVIPLKHLLAYLFFRHLL